jgi:hypothetical protein
LEERQPKDRDPACLDEKHFQLFVDFFLLAAGERAPLPALVTQAIVTPYGTNESGKLVHAVTIPWTAIIAQLSRDWNSAYEIPPEKWEELIAAAFDRAGYDKVTLTPRSNDHGRDATRANCHLPNGRRFFHSIHRRGLRP